MTASARFIDHWDRYCDLCLAGEVPFNHQAYVRDIVQCKMLCRDPEGGYARWVCPGCHYEHRVSFSCKTRFYPSCGKVRVDKWVNNINKDMLEVPHLYITLTIDDSFRPFFRRDSWLLKELLHLDAQAVQKVLSDLYPGMQIGSVYTVHTFGRDLGYKPHVHLVITKGGRQCWHGCRRCQQSCLSSRAWQLGFTRLAMPRGFRRFRARKSGVVGPKYSQDQNCSSKNKGKNAVF
jgi:hypothetical protein